MSYNIIVMSILYVEEEGVFNLHFILSRWDIKMEKFVKKTTLSTANTSSTISITTGM